MIAKMLAFVLSTLFLSTGFAQAAEVGKIYQGSNGYVGPGQYSQYKAPQANLYLNLGSGEQKTDFDSTDEYDMKTKLKATQFALTPYYANDTGLVFGLEVVKNSIEADMESPVSDKTYTIKQGILELAPVIAFTLPQNITLGLRFSNKEYDVNYDEELGTEDYDFTTQSYQLGAQMMLNEMTLGFAYNSKIEEEYTYTSDGGSVKSTFYEAPYLSLYGRLPLSAQLALFVALSYAMYDSPEEGDALEEDGMSIKDKTGLVVRAEFAINDGMRVHAGIKHDGATMARGTNDLDLDLDLLATVSPNVEVGGIIGYTIGSRDYDYDENKYKDEYSSTRFGVTAAALF